nr:hypothetical protein Iba_chr09bCG4960 [Ipomoea batatas]GMD38620.1 hypothetical protein Iba_chr09fCG5740 [Ipomoea batatas]
MAYAFGNGLFSRNDLRRIKACRGRCKGTSWPAPVTVTRVNPLYIWLHPPTFPLSYQGYQLATVGSFNASMEYRVAVTGTTESVSPLQNKKILRPAAISSR